MALQLVGGESGKAKEAIGTIGGACVRGEEAKSGQESLHRSVVGVLALEEGKGLLEGFGSLYVALIFELQQA